MLRVSGRSALFTVCLEAMMFATISCIIMTTTTKKTFCNLELCSNFSKTLLMIMQVTHKTQLTIKSHPFIRCGKVRHHITYWTYVCHSTSLIPVFALATAHSASPVLRRGTVCRLTFKLHQHLPTFKNRLKTRLFWRWYFAA